MSESMPRSKNPTEGSGVEGRRSTACTSPCRNETMRLPRSDIGVSRSRVATSAEEAARPSSDSASAERRSSRKGGRASTASSKTLQSIDITTDVVTSWRTRRSIAFRPCCGVNQRPPSAERCLSIRSFCSAASPISDHAPHAMACPGSPIARRWPAS